MASATFRKIRSSQMIGVEPDNAGMASFQATFSVWDHFTGRFFSVLIPFRAGPRHCGQFSAASGFGEMTLHASTAANVRLRIFLLPHHGPRLITKITKITKTTKNFVIFVP